MGEIFEVSWNSCKLIEEQENGELKLLKENLTQLMSKLNKPEFQDIPIVLLCILGGKQSGKSFYTNLIAEYLKYDGQLWTKGMKEEGLKGFAFGSAEMRVSGGKVDGIFEPGEEERSGVYFWPEIFLLEQCTGKKLLWIMHMYDGKGEENISDGPVTNFVKVASSRLVDIIWKDEIVSEKLKESVENHPLSLNFCQSKVYLLIGSPETQPKDISNVIKIPEFLKHIHNDRGIVNFGMKQLSVEKFIKAVINDHELQPTTFRMDSNSKPTPLTTNLIENGLSWYVNLINFKQNCTSSLVPVQHQETSQLQRNTSTKTTAPELTPQSPDNGSLENNAEGTNNISTPNPNQLKSQDEKACSEDTHEDDQLNAHDKRLKKYIDEEYLSSRNWKFLKKCLRTWIYKTLTCKNVGEMINILNGIAANKAGEEVDKLIRQGVSSEQAMKVIQIARVEENVLKSKTKIECLQSGLMKFCSELDAQFHITTYFPEPELIQTTEKIKTKIRDSLLNEDVRDLFDEGCRKVIREYKELNAKIENETKILLESQQQIVRFYQEEMGQVLKSEKFQIPDRLKIIHDQLALDLLRVFEDSLGKDEKMPKLAMGELSKRLEKEFKLIRRKNQEKIAASQRRIYNFIVQMKKDYEIEMDALLEANEYGVAPRKFAAEHEKAAINVTKKFKELLVSETREGDPVDMHLKTLTAYVNKSLEDFEEENEMNLKASEKANECKTALPMEQETTRVVPKSVTVSTQGFPLLFHLTYSKIGIGSRINLSNEEIIYVPAVVTQTTSNKWIVGDEIVKAALTEKCIKKSWEIGQFYPTSSNNIPDQDNSPYVIEDDNEKLEITLQFLLAVFFANYKHKLEQQYERIFSDAMIAVPFWFPGSQRQQILEASKIAGFTSANLFNENSSAAYFMYSGGLVDSKTSNQCNALIISENSNRVDMSLYFYNKSTRKLKMKGHTGDYEEKMSNAGGAQSWSLIGILITGAKAIGSKFNKKSAEESGVKKLKEKLDHMCAHSTKMGCPITNIGKSKVVIMTENANWSNLLEKVGDYVSPFVTRDSSRFAILGLASIFEATQNDVRELGNLIEDGIPFCLNIYPPNGRSRVEMQGKSDTLVRKPKFVLESNVAAVKGSYEVVQENASWKMTVGLLVIQTLRPGCTEIKIRMERTSDGIFELKKVEWSQKGKMKPDEFRWEANKMSTEKLKRYSIYFNSMYTKNSSKLTKLKDLKEKAISSAKELEQAIESECKGSFPSKIVKTLTLKTIHDARKFLEESERSENDVQQKINILECMKKDYKID